MMTVTGDAVKALLKVDPSLTAADRARIMATVRNHGKHVARVPTEVAVENHVLTRGGVARRFDRSLRFVDRLAAEGILRRVRLPGRVRACGFLAEEVERVIAGEGGEA